MTQKKTVRKQGREGGFHFENVEHFANKRTSPERETAILCIKTVVKLAKWRKLLERGK